jgi:hypothetical protein
MPAVSAHCCGQGGEAPLGEIPLEGEINREGHG